MKRNWLIGVVVVLVLSNVLSVFINALFIVVIPVYHYQTANAEFEFTAIPSKGRDIEMMERHFQTFKDGNSKDEEHELFRTFKRNPLMFWNWYSYITNEIYDYDYQQATSSD